MDPKDYIKIFEQSSELLVVIDTNFAIVAASDAFLKTTVTTRENIVGRDILKVFLDNPDDKTANGESIIRASFNRVIKNKTKDTLPVVKYDIPKLESEGGEYELKYWQAINSPVLDEMNNVKYIIQRVKDVTENETLITQYEFDKKSLKLLEDSEKRYNMMLMKSPFAFAVLKGKNREIAFANDRLKEIWGKGNNIEGQPLLEVLPELKDTPFPDLIDEVYKTGIPYHANEVLAPKHIKGQKDDIYYNFIYQPYREADETISGVAIIAAEVTAAVMVKKALEVQHEVEQKAFKQIEDSEKRYNMMLMKSPFAFAVLKGKNMVITLANDSIKEIWGKGKDLEGKPLLEVLPEIKNSEFPALLDNVYTTGVPFYGEELLAPIFRNGKKEDVYFNFVYQPYFEADETISGVTIIAYEVTAQVIVKKALAAQREAEKKALKLVEETNKRYYTMLMESPFAFSIMKGKDMVVTLANNLMKEFWGKGMNVEGKTLLQVLPELKDQPFPAMLDSVYTTGIPVYANEILARLQHKDKMEERYFNIVYQPDHDADGTISGVITIAYDVTEMILARKKIETSEARFKSIVMQTPVAIGIYKGKEYIAEIANEHCLQMLSKGVDFVGKPLFDILPELETQGFKGLMDNVIESGTTYYGNELAFNIHKNNISTQGFYNFIIQQLRADDESVTGIIVVASEVTEQVLARQKVEESELRFRNLIYTSPSAIGILLGEDLVITIANEPIIEILGKGKGIMGKKYFEALPELAEQGYKEVFNQVYKTGIPFNAIETPVNILQNGVTTFKYYNFILYPQKNTNGDINGIGIIATEVTSQAKHNLQIKESEERFRLLVMQAPVAICVVRGENYVVEIVNAGMLEFWGRTEAQILYNPIFEVLTELDGQVFEALVDEVYTTGQRFVATEFPITLLRKGQLENAYVTFIYEPLREVDGTISGIMVLAHEITDLVVARKKIEAQVIMHEEMLMNAPYVVCTLEGPNHVFSFVNKQYQQLFGGRILKGEPFLKAIPEFEGQGFDKILDKIYNTGETYVGFDIPATFAREEGRTSELRYFNFSYQPIFDENRKIYSILGFGYEVTEVVKAKLMIEQSELQFRVLTNSMPQKITNADAAGNVIFFNQQWIDDTGLTFEELRDWGWEKSIHTDDLKLTVANWKHSVATGDVFDMECRIQNKEGEYRWHLSRTVPIKDETGKIIMWVGSNTDIHELKEAKRKAETATQIAESAVKAKQQFLSNMSHEIRTPMNAIIGFTNVVLKTDLSKKQKEYINAIKVSGDALIVLINDILDLAKVDAGKMTFEQTPFALSEFIAATLHLFEPKIQEKNLELIEKYDAAIPKILLGDSVRLRQIILNLLSNAVKFTDEGKITVSVRRLKEEADSIAIEFLVTDTGIGIAENKLEHIFDDFQQATNETSRLHGGTGLGLTIVKRFVELQSGTLIINSKPGKGSTFGFILNFKKATAQTTEKADIKGTDNTVELAERIENKRILVVEDVPLNQLLIKIILIDFGFDVDIAGNGKIAIEKLQENKYDIILMDLQMPELNGFEATEHIRSKMNSQIPIIALTADVTTVDVEKCKAVGMNDYISKPIDEKLLHSKIIKYLKTTN